MTAGDYFGELALLSREKRTATARARGYCDMSVLRRTDLDNLLNEYPEMEPALKAVRLLGGEGSKGDACTQASSGMCHHSHTSPAPPPRRSPKSASSSGRTASEPPTALPRWLASC